MNTYERIDIAQNIEAVRSHLMKIAASHITVFADYGAQRNCFALVNDSEDKLICKMAF